MKRKTSEKGKAWLKREMRPYRAFILFLSILTVLTSVLSIAFAYLIRYLINSATSGSEKQLVIFAAVLLGVLLLKIFVQTISSYYAEKTRARITSELRTKTFSSLLHSDYASVQTYHSGDLLNRITSDVNEVAVDTVGIAPSIVGLAVQCVGAIAALLTLDPLFTAIYVACGLIGGGISALFRKHVKKCHTQFLEADGSVRSFMQESFTSLLTVKAYAAEKSSAKIAENLSETYYQKRMKRNVLRTLMQAVFTLLSNVGLIFAVVWCSVGLLSGRITDFGSILSIVLLLNQIQHPFSAFSSIIPVYYSRMASGERLQELYDLPKEKADESVEEPFYDQLQNFSFDAVSFDYGRESVLKNAFCTLQKGEIVCVTGPSGSGKSTLFKMLLSVYAPKEGEVNIHTENGKIPLTVNDRSLFAYVPQGNFLFSGSIYENLTFFMKNKEEEGMQEKVKRAISLACADFVFELPNGLETSLSERGGGLSEGQLQRLAIARALLSERPVLLLDESTSALDGETEKKVLQNISQIEGKTCILVTHRPAALTIADTVLEVKDGQIQKIK